MRIYALQLDIAWEDKSTNFARVREILDATAPEAGGMVVLPEMFATGFSMDAAAICEAPDGPTAQFLRECAAGHGVYVIGGVATEYAGERRVNEALVCAPDGTERGRYAKMYPFSLGGEGDHYAAGDTTTTIDCGGIACAPMVCYDLRFPEIFRDAARDGAALYAVIANWPDTRAAHWTALLRARAIENQAYVVGVNRCGSDPKSNYLGQSIIVDPLGEVLADAGGSEGIIEADVDLEGLAAYRDKFPALKDMRRG